MARGHTFADPDVKAEMLNLRTQGYSYVEIARKYHCDHTTVIYHCQLAGLAVSRDVRDMIFILKKRGFSQEQIVEQLKIPGTVVEFYCYRYGPKYNKLFGRTNLHLGQIVPRTPQIKDQVTPQIKTIPVIRMDTRGVEWREDGHGGWLCGGMSEKQYKQDIADRKKKELERKRVEMLTY